MKDRLLKFGGCHIQCSHIVRFSYAIKSASEFRVYVCAIDNCTMEEWFDTEDEAISREENIALHINAQ